MKGLKGFRIKWNYSAEIAEKLVEAFFTGVAYRQGRWWEAEMHLIDGDFDQKEAENSPSNIYESRDKEKFLMISEKGNEIRFDFIVPTDSSRTIEVLNKLFEEEELNHRIYVYAGDYKKEKGYDSFMGQYPSSFFSEGRGGGLSINDAAKHGWR